MKARTKSWVIDGAWMHRRVVGCLCESPALAYTLILRYPFQYYFIAFLSFESRRERSAICHSLQHALHQMWGLAPRVTDGWMASPASTEAEFLFSPFYFCSGSSWQPPKKGRSHEKAPVGKTEPHLLYRYNLSLLPLPFFLPHCSFYWYTHHHHSAA